MAQARLAGVLYLIIILCAGFSEGYVRGGVIVSGDAAATAANIRASEWLFRIGFTTDLLAFLSDVALAVLFYVLLRPVDQVIAMIAAAFRLAQASILGINLLNHFEVILLSSEAGYLGVFSSAQIDALMLHALETHRHGYLISQMFFGVHCLLIGYLLWRAASFPRAIGALMVIAGVGYLADGFGFFLLPSVAPTVSPFFLTPVVVAELSLCLWLLLKGVRTHDAGRGGGHGREFRAVT